MANSGISKKYSELRAELRSHVNANSAMTYWCQWHIQPNCTESVPIKPGFARVPSNHALLLLIAFDGFRLI